MHSRLTGKSTSFAAGTYPLAPGSADASVLGLTCVRHSCMLCAALLPASLVHRVTVLAALSRSAAYIVTYGHSCLTSNLLHGGGRTSQELSQRGELPGHGVTTKRV